MIEWKKIFDEYSKFLLFIIGLVFVPIFTALPIAKSYGITTIQVYFGFSTFYVISFVIVAIIVTIPTYLKNIINEEVYSILIKEEIIRGLKNEKKN